MKQRRLFQLATLFLFFYALSITLSNSARFHSWKVEYQWAHWLGFFVWLICAYLIDNCSSKKTPHRDPYILPAVLLLTGWGILEIWRLNTYAGLRQTLWLIVGTSAFIGGLHIKGLLFSLRRYKYFWLFSGLAITAITLIFGTYPEGVGPRLWLNLGGVYFQPSEPLKLLLIIFLAAYLADKLPFSSNFLQLITPTLLVFFTSILILLAQRDLGTASIFIVLYTFMLFITLGRLWILIFSSISIGIAGLLGYLLFDLVQLRVNAWLNPWLDPSGDSYQIVQSIISLAAGKILGRGPGLGTPTLVPIAHSDFIYTAIIEETGFVGALAMILIISIILIRSMKSAFNAPSNFQSYLSAGLAIYITIQSILIIGGNIRLLPLTGVTLPFISYGGSSLLSSFLALLLISLVSNNANSSTSKPLENKKPILITTFILIFFLFLITLITGWWSVVKSTKLLARPDNARPTISDIYVPRGKILDRNGHALAFTVGNPGNYSRVVPYEPLSTTIGYSNIWFGKSGLESGFNNYLNGNLGYPDYTYTFHYLLYGQSPPGLDIKTTIDLDLQQQADQLLEPYNGALVLINANNGEILSIVSHPYYLSAELENDMNNLNQNQDSPLLNRVTQGLYSPGSAFAPLLAAQAIEHQFTFNDFIDTPASSCLTTPANSSWHEHIKHGCSDVIYALAEHLSNQTANTFLQSSGLTEQPDFIMDIANTPIQNPESDLLSFFNEPTSFYITPIQLALANASLSANGKKPSPTISLAYEDPQNQWIAINNNPEFLTLFSKETANRTAKMLRHEKLPIWYSIGAPLIEKTNTVWYLAGTISDENLPALSLVIVLEKNEPSEIVDIGEQFMEFAIQNSQ